MMVHLVIDFEKKNLKQFLSIWCVVVKRVYLFTVLMQNFSYIFYSFNSWNCITSFIGQLNQIFENLRFFRGFIWQCTFQVTKPNANHLKVGKRFETVLKIKFQIRSYAILYLRSTSILSHVIISSFKGVTLKSSEYYFK